MKTVSVELFNLIQSLSKQERRYFKIFASRHSIEGQNKYVRLFDAVAKQKKYDEAKIKQKFAGETFIRQLHVTKNYLYNLILRSLRQFTEEKREDKFPLLIHNAQILFEKGLFTQSSKVLNKAKKLAEANENFLQLLEVFRWEHNIIHSHNDFKKLEQYVRVDFNSELKTLEKYQNYLQFQLLNDKVFIPYWKKGMIRIQEEREALENLFDEDIYQDVNNAQSFNARYFYHNARFTYFFLIGELDKGYHHIRQQVSLFEQLDTAQLKYKGLRRYTSTLINLYAVQRQLNKFNEGFRTLHQLRTIPVDSLAQKARLFIRSYNLETDLYIFTGRFSEGIHNLDSFNSDLDKYLEYIDNQQRLAIYYNMAYLHFGANQYELALDWMNRLLNDPDLKTREDIHCFGRILNLFIHYELENDKLLEYITKSTYRFLYKRKRLFKVESLILDFLKKFPDWTSPSEIKNGYQTFISDLAPLKKDEYESRAFEYFDFHSWLQAKIENVSFEDVMIQLNPSNQTV